MSLKRGVRLVGVIAAAAAAGLSLVSVSAASAQPCNKDAGCSQDGGTGWRMGWIKKKLPDGYYYWVYDLYMERAPGDCIGFDGQGVVCPVK